MMMVLQGSSPSSGKGGAVIKKQRAGFVSPAKKVGQKEREVERIGPTREICPSPNTCENLPG